MKPDPLRVAVLISGTGSNLKTLIDARRHGRLDIDIVRVISNRPDAPGLQHARAANIGCRIVGGGTRDEQDREIAETLAGHAVELVVLAGFMSIIGAPLVSAYAGRMINLHPALLPLYPGLDTYRRALAAGDRQHGASIHFVTTALDAGPVISQVRIPVLEDDTPERLATRLGPREHCLLVATVELFARRRVEMHSDSVLLDGERLASPLQLNEQDQFEGID